jgi:hypothetical protein
LFVVGTGGGFSTSFSLREFVTSPNLVAEDSLVRVWKE